MEDFINIKKTCGFYVSNIHLVTMILPFIRKQIEKNILIETFFEQNLSDRINNMLENNLIINKKNKKEILNINWENNKYENNYLIEKRINNILKNNKEVDFLISGSKENIENINLIIQKVINKNTVKRKVKNILIINCYEANSIENNIKKILDENEYIINTAGVHKVSDIFVNYKNKIAN